jgi:hypothetical protein
MALISKKLKIYPQRKAYRAGNRSATFCIYAARPKETYLQGDRPVYTVYVVNTSKLEGKSMLMHQRLFKDGIVPPLDDPAWRKKRLVSFRLDAKFLMMLDAVVGKYEQEHRAGKLRWFWARNGEISRSSILRELVGAAYDQKIASQPVTSPIEKPSKKPLKKRHK